MGIHTGYNTTQIINNANALEEEIENLENEIASYAIEINELNQKIADWQKATGCDSPTEYTSMKRSRDD